MNRGDAYALLATRLEELRGEGYDALLSRISQPANSRTIRINNEDVVVDVEVRWADKRSRALRVCAIASGPSTWHTEQLEESFLIRASHPAVGQPRPATERPGVTVSGIRTQPGVRPSNEKPADSVGAVVAAD